MSCLDLLSHHASPHLFTVIQLSCDVKLRREQAKNPTVSSLSIFTPPANTKLDPIDQNREDEAYNRIGIIT